MLNNELSASEEFAPRRKKNSRETDDPFYSEENLARLKKSAEQLERGQIVTKTLDELRELVYGKTAVL